MRASFVGTLPVQQMRAQVVIGISVYLIATVQPIYAEGAPLKRAFVRCLPINRSLKVFGIHRW